MPTTLKSQALHGAFWSLIERFGLIGVQFIVSMILARILTPAEFGLVAMIMIFTMLAQLVVTSGFGQALIQKRDRSQVDESTAFWFNIMLGAMMTTSLYLAAPLIAEFYNEPKLTPITRVASLNLFINSFGIVQNALLQKELLFRKRTIASMAGITISGISSVLMALNGLGVWALVFQVLINNIIRTVMIWGVHSWRPTFCFSTRSFASLYKFGSKILFSSILNTLYDNIYLLIIGKLFTATDLGFYQRAKEFIAASAQSIAQVIAQVNFPVLSKLQHDPRQMQNAFSQILQHALFVTIPLMIAIGVCAPNIIKVLLGEKWIPSTPYLRLLCIVGALFPIHLLNLNSIMALGRPDLLLKLEIIKKVLISFGIYIAFRHGITALLVAQIVCSSLSLLINSHYSKKLLSYGLGKQILDNLKLLTSSLIMGIVVYLIGVVSIVNVAITLFIQVIVGVLLFTFTGWLMKDPVFCEWLDRGLKKMNSRK